MVIEEECCLEPLCFSLPIKYCNTRVECKSKMGAISFSKWMNTQVIKNEIYTAFALIMHLKVGNVETKFLPLKFHVAITNIKIPGPLSNRSSKSFLLITQWITNKFISFKFFLLNIKLPILDSSDILPLFLMWKG